MIGKVLAHYEILEQLGKGGMGEVYRARDKRLGRDVALKILPAELSSDPDRRKRFQREAQAIAALKHPNIVTIYAVEESDGRQFIAMELVEGETLAEKIPEGGMTLEHFFKYAVPLSDAIASAHEQGITHRDLKPANIMFDRDGRLKVLDFGLAKLLLAEDADDGQTIAAGSDTAAGQIMGTASYMSPEQAEGKPIDHRSDIFSLGIVLYEMATGVRPFRGDTPISTISAILKDSPQLVSDIRRQLPRHLGRIISHCIQKNPEERYQSAKDVRNELAGLKREVDSGDIMATMESMPIPPKTGSNRRRLALGIGAIAALAVIVLVWAQGRDAGSPGPQPPEPPSLVTASEFDDIQTKNERKMVVVLPFENLGKPEDSYFAAGMTDEITSRISSVGDLGVISRSSATQYDRSGKTMRQIGADLGVDYVLEGTVRWAKDADGTDRVRITPQLVRVSDDTQMWSQPYDRNIDDVFEVQTEIANQVVRQLGVTLTQGEQKQLDTTPTQNVEAYKLYLQAVDLHENEFLSSDSLCTALLEQAVALDPGFVQGWATLATHHLDWYSGFDKSDERLAQARRALRSAESRDADHLETRLARGHYQYYGFDNYEQALVEFEAVALLSPSHPLARLQVGNIHRRLGNMESAIDSQKMAVLLDPKSVNNIMQLGMSYAGTRQFEKALSCFQPMIDQGGTTAARAANLSASTLLAWKGDLSLFRDPPKTLGTSFLKLQYAAIVGDYESALQEFENLDDHPLLQVRGFGSSMLLWKGMLIYISQSPEAAAPTLREALARLEDDLDESPDSNHIRGWMAATLALLGEEASALREAQLAVDRSVRDKFFGVGHQETLAFVLAVFGDDEAALDLIEMLLKTDYDEALTPNRLRLQPQWRYFLGDNPRFQTLISDEA